MTDKENEALQFLLSTLVYRLQDLAIKYKAFKQASPEPEDERMRIILESAEFVQMRQKTNQLRNQAVQAVRTQNLDQVSELLGELAGELGLAQFDSRKGQTL